MKKDKMEKFEQQVAAYLRSGNPFTGEGGVLTPLIKRVLEQPWKGNWPFTYPRQKGRVKQV